MRKWEHTWIEGKSHKELDSGADILGNEGWELVAAGYTTVTFWAIFKREVQDARQ